MRSAASRFRAAAPRSPRQAMQPRCAVAVAEGDDLAQGRIAAALAADGLEVVVHPWMEELESFLESTRPDVLVLGCDIARAGTVAVLRRVRRVVPETRMVVVSPSRYGIGGRRALNAGADGFVLDSAVDVMLVASVRAVHAGQVCAPPELRRLVAKPSFSQREKEILALVATGRTNQEIAGRLFLTESTVKSHLASAFEKLGVRSRKDAAALLLDPEEGLQQTALPQAAPPAAAVNGLNGRAPGR
jgi:DNA-binding NarL/FixJ family response regulator